MDGIEAEIRDCAEWSDERLTRELAEAARMERGALVSLLVRLGEFYKRDLSLQRGSPNIYDYCMRVLGYSRSAAGRRIAAARAARKYPCILTKLQRGELHLTGVAMLSRHLTPENYEPLLARARGKAEDEIDRIIAAIAQRPLPKDTVRAVRAPLQDAAVASPPLPPTSAPTSAQIAAPAQPCGTPASRTSPLSHQDAQPACQATSAAGADLFGDPTREQPKESLPEIFAITFAASRETCELLARAEEVLRHRFPKGETNEVVNLALKELLAEVDRDLRKPPRSSKVKPTEATPSRYIPEAVKHEAWKRDGGQCAYVSPNGTRCTARTWIEFDHVMPFAKGGSSRDPNNIRPYCRPHNQWAARQAFGSWPRPPS